MVLDIAGVCLAHIQDVDAQLCPHTPVSRLLATMVQTIHRVRSQIYWNYDGGARWKAETLASTVWAQEERLVKRCQGCFLHMEPLDLECYAAHDCLSNLELTENLEGMLVVHFPVRNFGRREYMPQIPAQCYLVFDVKSGSPLALDVTFQGSQKSSELYRAEHAAIFRCHQDTDFEQQIAYRYIPSSRSGVPH